MLDASPAAFGRLDDLLFQLVQLFCRKPLIAVPVLAKTNHLSITGLSPGPFKLGKDPMAYLLCQKPTRLALDGRLFYEFPSR